MSGATPGAAQFREFTEAVLAQHRRRDFPALNRVMCSCGLLEHECPVRGIARRLGLLT
jgi:hypothetical protein